MNNVIKFLPLYPDRDDILKAFKENQAIIQQAIHIINIAYQENEILITRLEKGK